MANEFIKIDASMEIDFQPLDDVISKLEKLRQQHGGDCKVVCEVEENYDWNRFDERVSTHEVRFGIMKK